MYVLASACVCVGFYNFECYSACARALVCVSRRAQTQLPLTNKTGFLFILFCPQMASVDGASHLSVNIARAAGGGGRAATATIGPIQRVEGGA